MKRSSALAVSLGLPLLLAGCAGNGYDDTGIDAMESSTSMYSSSFDSMMPSSLPPTDSGSTLMMQSSSPSM